jgi:uncharacterized protein (DUF302 family)
MPVVDERTPTVIRGVVSRRAVLGALDRELLQRDLLYTRVTAFEGDQESADYLELPRGQRIEVIAPPPEWLERPLDPSGVRAGQGINVIAVRRENTAGAARAEWVDANGVVLGALDRLLVIGTPEAIDLLRTTSAPGEPSWARLALTQREVSMSDFGMTRVLDATFEEALARIPDALRAEGFGVLTDIDVRDTLKKKLGVDFRRYRILGACNPPLAHQALSSELDVGVMLPCNIVVYENDEGRAVVTAIDPMRTLARDHVELRGIAETVRGKLERFLDSLR